MAALNIIDVNILPNNNRTSVTAETDTSFEFVFDRDLQPTDSPVIRCHLHDTVFDLEYYLPDITVSVTPKVNLTGNRILSPKYRVKLKFPEELAGAKLVMTFYMKLDPGSLEEYAIASNPTNAGNTATQPPLPATPITFTFEISSSDGGPKIEAVYWANDENIKFGEHSTPRTDPVHKNETAILHIHTRGLYGKEVKYTIDPFRESILKVKNNTAVKTIQVFNNASGLSGQRNLTGKVKRLNVSSYSRSASVPLDLLTDATIIPVTVQVIASIGRDILPPLGSFAECRVEFRPDEDYAGNFGFSWFRKGELHAYPGTTNRRNNRTNATKDINKPCNDQPFAETMGRHYDTACTTPPRTSGVVIQDGNDSSPNFDIDPVMVENHKLDYRKLLLGWLGRNDEYLVPVMTIRKGEKAGLRLFIEAKKDVDKIVFEFDNPLAVKEGYLSIRPNSISNIPVTTPYGVSGHSIEIECHKEFSKELMLRAKAFRKNAPGKAEIIFPDICGAVRILPNDVSHQRNIKVVFFNVKTRLNGTQDIKGLPLTTDEENEKKHLKKFLNQAYVIPEIEIEDLNITSGKVRETDANPDTRYTGAIHNTHTRFDTTGIAVSSNVFHPDKTNALADFLSDRTGADPAFNKYKDWYKIFFIGDECVMGTFNPGPPSTISINKTNGFCSGKYEKFCVVFQHTENVVPVHELGHALGLPHTFDGHTARAKYVYQDGTTDNIMDYSHYEPLKVTRQSFFHWQWFAMNNKLP